MSAPVKLAIAGAGVIGRQHASAMRAAANAVELCAVVDPAPAGQAYANSLGLDWYPSLTDLFAAKKPDGVILATPNQAHVENGLECIAVGCPILVEKPIATTSVEARTLVDASNAANVPILVGHHRRHNPLIRRARKFIEDGRLGRIVTAQSSCWVLKPDDYYAPKWRRLPGAGPVIVNAIHDIDLMRYLCGEVASVSARASNAIRGHAIEDTLVGTLLFRSGTLGTISVSDCTAAPWSWELTSGENPAYPVVSENCYHIGGTAGSLSIPDNRLWNHVADGNWMTPINAVSEPTSHADPLVVQLQHFAEVIQGNEVPLVSGEEGMKSLCVAEALLCSAETGQTIELT